MHRRRMGQSSNEGVGARANVFTNESTDLSITQIINQRTNEPIDGPPTEAPAEPTNERVGEWSSQRENIQNDNTAQYNTTQYIIS